MDPVQQYLKYVEQQQFNFHKNLIRVILTFSNIRVLLLFIERQKKRVQKVWPKNLVYEKTFWLSSRTPHAFTIYYKLIKINVLNLKFLTSTKKTNICISDSLINYTKSVYKVKTPQT